MKRLLLIIGVSAIMLAAAAPANAYHVDPNFYHWPVETDNYNAGSCGTKGWIHIVDRTGYGEPKWKAEWQPAVISHLAASLNYRFCFSTEFRSRWDLWDGTQNRYEEMWPQITVGQIFVSRGSTSTKLVCANGPFYGPWPADYCPSLTTNHTTKCYAGAGASASDGRAVLPHEVGHCFGLNHRRIDASGNCDGISAMCALGYTKFDAHDKAEMNRAEMNFGHHLP